MKKIFLIVVFSFLIKIGFSQTTITRFIAVENRDDTLQILDTSNLNVVSKIIMTSDSIVRGATGLARHPITGVYYILFRTFPSSNRVLGTLDPATGHITIVGPTGDRISNIAFLPSGKLMGVTGKAATVQNSLFEISTVDGSLTFIRAIGSTEGGEALGYCPDNGHLYHRSGLTIPEYYKVDTLQYNLTPITETGNPADAELYCLFYVGNKKFISCGYDPNNLGYQVFNIDTLGNYTVKATLNQTYPFKGMDFLRCTRNITGTPSFCAGSSTTLTASAGASAYQWFKNGVLLNGETNQSLIVTTAGNYNCKISDLCSSDSLPASLIVTVKTLPSVNITGTSSFCAGGGTLLTGTSGGTSQWYKNMVAINGATSNTYLATAPGHYNMIKTNSNGCADSAAVGKNVVSNPLPIANLLAARNLKCNADNSGSIAVNVNNGTSPYTYSWSNGANTLSLSGIGAGNYQLIVSDSKSCKDTVDVVISEPAQIQVGISSTDVLCQGGNTGSALATASGGSGSLTYSWSNGNTNLSNINLTAGSYTFTASDDSLCTKNASVQINEPTALQLSFTHSDVLCHGGTDGTVNAIVSGGTGTYTYSWSAGIGPNSLTNLSAGVFQLVVSDVNGCTILDSVSVTEPNALSISGNAGSTSCYGSTDGFVSAIATGGTGNISYSWSIAGAFTSTVNNIGAGVYTIFINDDNGCSLFDSIEVIQPAILSANITSINDSCFGGNKGSISANPSGGAGNYIYSWSTGATTSSISNLAGGSYDLSITDGNSCTKDTTVTITAPSAALSIISSNIINTPSGQNSGAISVSVTGGTSPYTYSWSNGQTGDSIGNLALGNYSVVITDANGCSITSPNYSISIDDILTNTANSEIHLFPNPNKGIFQFKTTLNMHLVLINALNQVVREFDCEKNKTVFINEKINPGIYYLKGNSANKFVNYKIVITE